MLSPKEDQKSAAAASASAKGAAAGSLKSKNQQALVNRLAQPAEQKQRGNNGITVAQLPATVSSTATAEKVGQKQPSQKPKSQKSGAQPA